MFQDDGRSLSHLKPLGTWVKQRLLSQWGVPSIYSLHFLSIFPAC